MPFTFEETPIPGLLVIHPKVFEDERGFFLETYKESDFVSAGIPGNYAQDNHSLSARGVLRGLHFQVPPMDQGKLVRVVSGSVWDVAVDIRPASSTRCKWFGLELSAENKTMFYIPPGFAHGFITLEDDTHFLYKCTKEYSAEHERGIRSDDPNLSIEWPSIGAEMSDRDAALPYFHEIDKELA
jgi:dTDP-4-dehydrorhamnose 3,5-epimerase